MALLVLGIFIVYFFAVYGIVKLIRNYSHRQWPVWTIVFLAIAWPVIDLSIPRIMLALNCDIVGKRIFKTVEDVRGFYLVGYGQGCGGVCKEMLINERANSLGTYEYIEANSDYEMPSNLAPVPGLYHFSVERKGYEKCSLYRDYKDRIKAKNQLTNGKCVASKSIDKLSTNYKFEKMSYNTSSVFGDNVFSKNIASIIESGEVLAVRTLYGFSPRTFWSYIFGTQVCELNVDFLHVQEVLIPSAKHDDTMKDE